MHMLSCTRHDPAFNNENMFKNILSPNVDICIYSNIFIVAQRHFDIFSLHIAVIRRGNFNMFCLGAFFGKTSHTSSNGRLNDFSQLMELSTICNIILLSREMRRQM